MNRVYNELKEFICEKTLNFNIKRMNFQFDNNFVSNYIEIEKRNFHSVDMLFYIVEDDVFQPVGVFNNIQIKKVKEFFKKFTKLKTRNIFERK